MQRYIYSFGSDLVNAVANAKIVTLKHFLLGLGLHNIDWFENANQSFITFRTLH